MTNIKQSEPSSPQTRTGVAHELCHNETILAPGFVLKTVKHVLGLTEVSERLVNRKRIG